MAPKRKCIFNKTLEEEFPFIKKGITDSDVKCNKCSASFDIANSGRSAITRHIQAAKHKKANIRTSTSRSLNSFFVNKNFHDKLKASAIKAVSRCCH